MTLLTRQLSPRRIGSLVLLLALLLTIASYLLEAKLNYPAILLDKASFANALVMQGEIFALLGFVGLLLSGGLLVVISLGLMSDLEEKRRRRVVVTGGTSGVLWAVGALLGLVLVPIWGSATPTVAQVLAMIIFVLAEIGAPLLLTFWTVGLIRRFRVHTVLGWVGALGLLLIVLRSLVWLLNELLPVESGWYGTAGILAVLALVGESLWLVWLFLLGFHLMSWSNGTAGVVPMERTVLTREGEAKI